MVVTYRQLAAPAQVETFSVDTGGAQAANSLARALKGFEGITSDIGAQNSANAGAEQGTAAGASGNPQFKEGWRTLTAYGKAYNNAALRSYAIQSEASAEDTAARLEVEANNDPQKFAATFGAVRDATLKAAPPAARGVLVDIYNQHLSNGLARLSRGQAVEVQKQNLDTLYEGISRGVDRVSNLRAANDPLSMQQSDMEEQKLHMMLDAARNDGTLNDVQAQAIGQNVFEAITKQTVVAQFERVLEDPKGDPLEFLRRVQEYNKTSEVLPPEEEQKLQDALLSTLREHNAMASAAESQSRAEQQIRYAAGNQQASSDFLGGTLSRRKLREMVDNGDIDPTRATTLGNELDSQTREQRDDKNLLLQVESSLLDHTRDELMTMRGLSADTRRRLVSEWDRRSGSWESDQSAKEAFRRIDDKLGILPGTDTSLMSDERKTQRARARHELYDTIEGFLPGERTNKAILAAADEVMAKRITANHYEEAQKWAGFTQNAIDDYTNNQQHTPATLKTLNDNLARYKQNYDREMQLAK
jgi:hypothetical protein